jgi:tyrosinase
MYQAANPSTYMEPANVGDSGNVYLENYQMVDAKTELLPFRKSSGGFWTTNEIRSTETFGYAYPETQKNAQPSVADLQSSVKAVIARLYSSSARGMLTASPATADGRTLLSNDRTFTDWTITMQVPSSALPSTFVIHFLFTGDFSSDPVVDVGRWMKLMPSDHNTASHAPTQMTSTAANYQMIKGTVSLTTHLLEQVGAGKLASLDAVDVVPYLKESLTWKGISVSYPIFTLCKLG